MKAYSDDKGCTKTLDRNPTRYGIQSKPMNFATFRFRKLGHFITPLCEEVSNNNMVLGVNYTIDLTSMKSASVMTAKQMTDYWIKRSTKR
jgi:hypothetical protein